MYKPAYRDNFRRILRKLSKKDRVMFERIKRKAKEIVKNPYAYKPLSNVMKGFRAVHLDPFVMVFSVDEKEKRVWFEDFEHHDSAYK